MPEDPLSVDAVVAAADLVDRSGGREFEIGWLEDDVPIEEARWYCSARYRAMRVVADEKASPSEAADELARRILTGSKCRCGKLVALSPAGAEFGSGRFVDGTEWSPEQAADAGQCLWTRQGKRWEPGCDAPPIHAGERF